MNHMAMGMQHSTSDRHRKRCCTTNTQDSQAKTVLRVAAEKERLEIVQTPVIKSVIKHKWAAFGRTSFWRDLITLVVHLLLLMAAMFLQPFCPGDLLPASRYKLGEWFGSQNYGSCKTRYNMETDWLRIILELITTLYAVVLVVSGLVGLNEQNCANVLRQLRTNAYLVIHAACLVKVAVIRILIWQICFADGNEGACSATTKEVLNLIHLVVLCVGILVGWFRLLTLIRGTRQIGLLVVIMQEIFQRDVLRIAMLLFLVVLAFSQLFFVVCTTSIMSAAKTGGIPPSSNVTVYMNPLSDDVVTSLLTVFISALAPGQLSALEFAPTPNMLFLGLIFFAIFVLVSSIILLNLIIAIFNTRYMHFDSIADSEWFLQRTQYVLHAEVFRANRERWHSYMLDNPEFHKDGTGNFTFMVLTKPDNLTRDLPSRW